MRGATVKTAIKMLIAVFFFEELSY